MKPTDSRRHFLRVSSLGAAGLVLGGGHVASGQPPRSERSAPEHQDLAAFPRTQPGPSGPVGSGGDRGKLVPGRRSADLPPVEVETPDVPKLSCELKNGVKEFQLTAQHVRREILPDKIYDFWGYNGTMPGPAIEAVEGDRVRIVVHNKLPESTTVHWHGLELPIGMDGADNLTQEPIKPGRSFVYEFTLHQNGTFFYHSHGAMQQAIGMVGLFIVHPREAWQPAVDRDVAYVAQEFFVRSKATIPDTMNETFNFFTLNGRAAPFVTPLLVRLGDRVRLRFMNLSTMDHHPMHLHGHTFWVTGSEGGRIPESAWIPGNTVLVGVGQSRDVEFIANNPGDWMLHCHIPHHMMNQMVPMVGPHRIKLDDTSTAPRVNEHSDHGYHVPGYPQDMMDGPDMWDEFQLELLNVPQTRGLMPHWHRGLMGMMTIVRVLPGEQYEKLVGGMAEQR